MKNHSVIRVLTAVSLSAALALSGCGLNKKDKKDIGDVVGRFMESAFSMDRDGMLACVDEDSDYYELCAKDGAFDMSAEALGLSGDDIFGSQDFLDGVVGLTKKHSDYSLDSVKLSGKDRAVAEVTISVPDFEGLDLSETMSLEDIGFDVEDFLSFAREKGYDSEDLAALSATDPDAGEALVNDYMSSAEYKGRIISGVLSVMDENVAVNSSKAELTLIRSDDGWKITGEKELRDGQKEDQKEKE